VKDIPVALVCYNRPRHTAHVLAALKKHGITNLYVFCDGAKNSADAGAVAATRKLIDAISWTTAKVFKYHINRGLAASVVGAVNHVLQFHDRLILLEDDCVPGEYFFDFMNTCLRKYADNERIFGINGYTVPIPAHLLENHPYDVYFYPRIGSWGWATWKRAWRHYDTDLRKLYDRACRENIDLTQGGADIPSQVQRVLKGHDAWTLNWVLATYLNHGCYIYPTTSHIRNIGLDGSGTNFGRSRCRFENEICTSPPTRYPDGIVLNQELIDYYNSFFGPAKPTPRKRIVTVASDQAASPKDTPGPAAPGSGRHLSIVHINTHDLAGGAARVAWRLAEEQRRQGHDAVMLVGTRNSNSPCSFAFDPENNPDILNGCRTAGWLYYESQGSHKLVKNEHVASADILHLHNIHGYYFNPFSLSAISHFKPTVWTLHDMQSFTGHCAHSFGCAEWQRGCKRCDHLGLPPAIPVDTAGQLLADKKFIYDHSRLWLVSPSHWLKRRIEKSVLAGHPVEVICNGVDTSVFRPADKLSARREFGIPRDAIVIGTVAHGGAMDNIFKGGEYTRAVLEALSQKLPGHVFVGIGGKETARDERVVNIPAIDDENTLARAYSAMDIFLYTPLADNCPLVVLEALACGVAVAAFDTGGVGELVRNAHDGYITEYRNVEHLTEAVCKLAESPGMRNAFSANARQAAIDKYDHRITARKYHELYMRILEESRTRPRQARLFDMTRVPAIIKTREFIELENLKRETAGHHAEPKPANILPEARADYDVSIVLGTLNRAPLLDRMLSSIVRAADGIKYEIIVIDGGSTDNTLQVLQAHGIDQVYSESQCMGHGRHSWSEIFNFGFAKARGKWAMYGSDDIIYGKDCLAKAVEQLDRQGPEVAGGLFFYRNLHTRPDWDRHGIDFTYGPKLLMNYGLFRSDCFREVGGLNEQYRFYCADGDLCYRFYSTGRRFIVLPECFVVHDNAVDVHKSTHAADSAKDIELYRNNWKHFVSLDTPVPRRLLWHSDYIEAFNMPSRLDHAGAGIDHYWHGLACFQYGLFEQAQLKFQLAVDEGFDHRLVRWFLEESAEKRQRGDARKTTVDVAVEPACQQEQQDQPPDSPDPPDGHSLEAIRQAGLWRPGQPLRLHLGCGKWNFSGYVNIDYPPQHHNIVERLGADFTADIRQLSFPAGSVDEIRLHHVFEHFNRVEALAMLIRWHKWLRIGGQILIETPDLMASARTLLSEASWRTKMGVVRHLTGDQAAEWGYHVEQWFPERFEHTLGRLGFGDIRTETSSWSKEPCLSNVQVRAVKTAPADLNAQISIAGELLWESTVDAKEERTWRLWKQQLREALAPDFGGELPAAAKDDQENDLQERYRRQPVASVNSPEATT